MTGIANQFAKDLLANATYVDITTSMDHDKIIEALTNREIGVMKSVKSRSDSNFAGIGSCPLPGSPPLFVPKREMK